MVKFNDLLKLRLSKEKKPKITALAEKSNDGSLSSFSGIFKFHTLNEKEKENLKKILTSYSEETSSENIENDLKTLITLTSEVKAITNQAVILHGERIKKAQQILKNYKEGAFSAWLMATYGNRQTPYNFLQYYDFYTQMPHSLKPQIDAMPRQAIYTLASRVGDLEKKQDIIKSYQGQTKQEILSVIRKLFPLSQEDKRQPNLAEQAINNLRKISNLLSHPLFKPSKKQKEELFDIIDKIEKKI